MTQARTERGKYFFKVSEYGDGTCWISTENNGKHIPLLEEALLGFDLPTGTTVKKAQAIADFLNDNLGDVSITIFDTHPMYRKK